MRTSKRGSREPGGRYPHRNGSAQIQLGATREDSIRNAEADIDRHFTRIEQLEADVPKLVQKLYRRMSQNVVARRVVVTAIRMEIGMEYSERIVNDALAAAGIKSTAKGLVINPIDG